MKPKPIQYTVVEGGGWYPWGDMDSRREHNEGYGVRFHSIKFDDGSVFDMLNGWRMNPWNVVHDFEDALCAYTGAPYAVATNGCTMALFLSLLAHEVKGATITVPKRTYLSVPMMIKHAGAHVRFSDLEWRGAYPLYPFPIWDSARRFSGGMYNGGFHCVSFHPTKILGLSCGGGAILHDCQSVDLWLRRAVFHGRSPGLHPAQDTFKFCGYEARMWPATAAEGLQRLATLPKNNRDLPNSDYPDLSQISIFQDHQANRAIAREEQPPVDGICAVSLQART